MTDPIKISPVYTSGVYSEFININGDPNFVLNTQSKNLSYPEEKIVKGRVVVKAKPVRIVIRGKVLKETIVYIKGLIDNIKLFTKYTTGSLERKMMLSIVRSYRNNSLNLIGHIKKGDKEKYFVDLDNWVENLERSGTVTMKIKKDTAYYFANSKGQEISVSTGKEGIWMFPVSCKIIYTINAFSGYLPIPYFKILSITFLNVGTSGGLNIAPEDYILKYHKFETEINNFFSYVNKMGFSDSDIRKMINGLCSDLENKTNINESHSRDDFSSMSENEIKDVESEDEFDSVEEITDINDMWIDDDKAIEKLKDKKKQLKEKKEELKALNE